jgi:CBF1 interacting corepressor
MNGRKHTILIFKQKQQINNTTMVQGLKFLSKKGFNPQNQTNRKQVWEAQQYSKLEEERIGRRQDELKNEREDEEFCRIQHGDGSQAQLRFMYNAPPGIEKSEEEEGKSADHSNASSNDVTHIQPGDDAAAAAFRRMLASSATTQQTSQEEQEGAEETAQSTLRFEPVLQGSTMDPSEENQKTQEDDTRSKLEKAVGRRDRGGALTLEEQLARFPQLKNAPMAKGMSSTDVNVSFKPLGAQLRNVRCLSCGVWGHSRGDRECSKTGWNPFDLKRFTAAPAADASSIRPAAAPAADASSIRPRLEEKRKGRGDDDEESNSYRSSDDSRRRRRKRKHKKRKRRDKESKRHRRRRSRSESPRESKRDRQRRSRSGSPKEMKKM